MPSERTWRFPGPAAAARAATSPRQKAAGPFRPHPRDATRRRRPPFTGCSTGAGRAWPASSRRQLAGRLTCAPFRRRWLSPERPDAPVRADSVRGSAGADRQTSWLAGWLAGERRQSRKSNSGQTADGKAAAAAAPAQKQQARAGALPLFRRAPAWRTPSAQLEPDGRARNGVDSAGAALKCNAPRTMSALGVAGQDGQTPTTTTTTTGSERARERQQQLETKTRARFQAQIVFTRRWRRL